MFLPPFIVCLTLIVIILCHFSPVKSLQQSRLYIVVKRAEYAEFVETKARVERNPNQRRISGAARSLIKSQNLGISHSGNFPVLKRESCLFHLKKLPYFYLGNLLFLNLSYYDFPKLFRKFSFLMRHGNHLKSGNLIQLEIGMV